jgi:predicted RND superfamily exporter protein
VVLLIILSIISAIGLAGWMGIKLTPTSATAPTIILTMAVADCVHFLVTMLHNIRLDHEKKQAIQESLRINFQPIFLTSATTAIGFLSMNFSDAPPFRDLGNIVAMGVVIAFLLSVSFLPAIMAVLPVWTTRKDEPDNRYMKFLAEFVIRRKNILLLVNGTLAIALISMIPRNELNDEFVKYFDESIEFRQATDFLNANMGGIYAIEYSLHAGGEGAISGPQFLQQVDSYKQWLLRQPEVVHVNTITDTFKRLNKNMHADEPQWYQLPEQRDLAAQYLLLYEMSLPYGLDLNDQINLDKSAIRVIVTMQDMSTSQMLEIEQRIKNWLQQNMADIKVDGASPTLMFSHIGQRNVISMLIGTVAALVLISLILIIAFRSFKLGLISLIPNLIPAGMAFGIWALIDGRIGLSLSVVTGMTLGIVVDDTVHFISKYRRARIEHGYTSENAVRYAFSTVGIALWITSAVLVCGFIVLSTSDFAMNNGMGLMTAITIAVALFLDFLFLPPLLMSLERK